MDPKRTPRGHPPREGPRGTKRQSKWSPRRANGPQKDPESKYNGKVIQKDPPGDTPRAPRGHPGDTSA